MSYTFSLQPAIVSHATARQPLVADSSDMNDLLIEARLRSGDYFITLGTELEKLAALLEDQGVAEATALLQISTELTYLDKHYKLQAK